MAVVVLRHAIVSRLKAKLRGTPTPGAAARQAALRVRVGLGAVAMLAVFSAACGGGGSVPAATPGPSPSAGLTSAEVTSVVQNAAASVEGGFVVAVTDRSGRILAIHRKTGAPATAQGNFGQVVSTDELAVALARTASFFSNNQAPLSSRTVRFISGIHFPPGVENTANAALYGIENTNRGCPLNADFAPGQSVPPARSIDGSQVGLGVITGKQDTDDSNPAAVNPGGVPLFKNGVVVGGVGVAGGSPEVNEFAAFSGAVGAGFGPQPAAPGVVIVDGIALPFVNQSTRPSGLGAGSFNGSFQFGPIAGATSVPEGDMVLPRAGPIGGLTQAEVRQIIDRGVQVGNETRAVIRLPLGSRARFVLAVADLDGNILALHRMPDSTVFSIDVAVAKARNMVYFSDPGVPAAELPGVPPGTAVTNRTISFGAQPIYPPGIEGTNPGPFFDLYVNDVANPCTQGAQPANPNQNGIVFFPGAVPLYRNGVLVGGLGVSGDGVEQDDYVSALAAEGFEAPADMRADQIVIRDARLPYLKFPRNPTE
jgi:uncharacterized protein GlcG (DUF336 family)